MKFFNITLLFVILALACCLSTTMADDAKRPGLRRPPGAKAAKTSTTTSNPADDDEGDYPDNGEDLPEGEEGEDADVSTTTTTTEAPKRIGPVIRPFRSNDDFLNSLKRRQMNAKKAKSEKPAPKPKAAASQDSDDEEEDGAQAPKGFSKPNSAANRNRKVAGKPSKPEPVDEEGDEAEAEPKEEKPKRPLGGRLPLRKRN